MDAQDPVYSLSLGGIPLALKLRYPDTAQYFRRYLSTGNEKITGTVSVPDRAFADWASAGNAMDAFGEFCLFCQSVSEALMDQGGCVFHAAALRFRDRAVLLAGGSGAGKSTHLRKLLEGHPGEFSVINGDKPVLRFSEEGVMVHPSPWNGKEGLRGAEAAPLAAIYFLNRTDKDEVEPCPPRKAGAFVFPMVFQSYFDEDVIRKAAAAAEKIVTAAPCFIFHTRDIDRSSALLYRSIEEVTRHGL